MYFKNKQSCGRRLRLSWRTKHCSLSQKCPSGSRPGGVALAPACSAQPVLQGNTEEQSQDNLRNEEPGGLSCTVSEGFIVIETLMGPGTQDPD